MLQELLSLLPRGAGEGVGLATALGGILCGLAIWLFGARFGRAILTLTAVTVGALVGLYIPRWLGWPIGGWATSVGLAMVLGLGAYIIHNMFVGMALGVVLLIWASLGVWVAYNHDIIWQWPDTSQIESLPGYIWQVWKELPQEWEDMRGVLPLAALMAWAGGMGLGILWPRLASSLLYSMVGLSVMLVFGLLLAQESRSPWVTSLLATDYRGQVAILGFWIVLGMGLQWRLAGFHRLVRKIVPAPPPPADD